MRFLNLALICLAFGLSLDATVSLTDALGHVYSKGPRELLGSLTVTFDSNDFPSASPDHPYFMKYALPYNNVSLSQTLVDPLDPARDQPLYLPLLVLGSGATLSAPANAVSIVRWVAGEQAVWIRIQSDLDGWVTRQGVVGPPSAEAPVQLILGTQASLFEIFHDEPGVLSLPFPTRTPNQPSIDSAESTLLIADLSASVGLSERLYAQLYYDLVFYDASAELSPGNFRGDASPWLIPLEGGVTAANVYEWGGKAHFSAEALGEGEESARARLHFSINGSGLSESFVLFPGSMIRLECESDAIGFPEGAAAFDLPGQPAGSLWLDPETSRNLQGRQAFGAMTLTWTGEALSLDALEIPLKLAILGEDSDLRNVKVRFQVFQSSGADWLDEAPYDAAWQARLPEPYQVLLEQGLWVPFAPLSSDVALPHLTRSNGGFETQLRFFHDDSRTRQLLAQGYLEDGTALEPERISVAPGIDFVISAKTLFSGQEAASLTLAFADEEDSSASFYALASYRAEVEQAVPAQVSFKSTKSKRWRFYPGERTSSWDGLAVFNPATVSCSLTLREYDAQGERLCEREVVMPPHGKWLQVLEPCDENSAHFELEANEAVQLEALRGDLSHLYLWENPAIELP